MSGARSGRGARHTVGGTPQAAGVVHGQVLTGIEPLGRIVVCGDGDAPPSLLDPVPSGAREYEVLHRIRAVGWMPTPPSMWGSLIGDRQRQGSVGKGGQPVGYRLVEP